MSPVTQNSAPVTRPQANRGWGHPLSILLKLAHSKRERYMESEGASKKESDSVAQWIQPWVQTSALNAAYVFALSTLWIKQVFLCIQPTSSVDQNHLFLCLHGPKVNTSTIVLYYNKSVLRKTIRSSSTLDKPEPVKNIDCGKLTKEAKRRWYRTRLRKESHSKVVFIFTWSWFIPI